MLITKKNFAALSLASLIAFSVNASDSEQQFSLTVKGKGMSFSQDLSRELGFGTTTVSIAGKKLTNPEYWISFNSSNPALTIIGGGDIENFNLSLTVKGCSKVSAFKLETQTFTLCNMDVQVKKIVETNDETQ